MPDPRKQRVRPSDVLDRSVLPGSGEKPVAPVYIDGEKSVTLKGENIAEAFQMMIEDYVRQNYPPSGEQISRHKP